MQQKPFCLHLQFLAASALAWSSFLSFGPGAAELGKDPKLLTLGPFWGVGKAGGRLKEEWTGKDEEFVYCVGFTPKLRNYAKQQQHISRSQVSWK